MPSFRTTVLAVAASLAAVAQADYVIDPESVPLSERREHTHIILALIRMSRANMANRGLVCFREADMPHHLPTARRWNHQGQHLQPCTSPQLE